VNFLWNGRHQNIFFACTLAISRIVHRRAGFRTSLRLIRIGSPIKNPCNFHNNTRRLLSARASVTKHVHRFEESIAGRAYLIEVSAVDTNRWRACLARTAGGPTALMPFYGTTPDGAALQLRTWLVKAHERALQGARPA
jgi:hypothetical protein